MPSSSDAGVHDREPRALERFLRDAGEAAEVVCWRPLSGGRSAETIRVKLAGASGERDCVLHVEPRSGPLAGVSRVANQFAVLQVVERAGIPAPRPMWLCADESVLGSPFLVTDFVPGAVPSPWREQGRRFLERHPPGGPLARRFVETLASIHAVPLDEIPAAVRGRDPAAARSFAEHERRRWSAIVAQSREFADDPLLAYADGWLAGRRPAASAPGLVHGDYRIGNLVIDRRRIAAVLDWELAEAGDPVYDLGILCSPALRTNGLASGLWEPEALVEHYEEVSGRAVDRDAVAFYRVLATYRTMALWVNASRSFAEGADDLASLRAGFSAVETRPLLAESLGLDVPRVMRGGDPSARAAATLFGALREDVLPAVDSGRSEETLRSVLSVLRTQREASPPVELAGFANAVAALEDDLRRHGAPPPDTTADVSPLARLGRLARAIMRDPAIVRDEDHPLHERLRVLVGRAAAPGLGGWPC